MIVVLIFFLIVVSLMLVLGISLGIGWALTLFLPFTLFEGTLLAMTACFIIGLTWYNVIRSIPDFASGPYDYDEEAEDAENDLIYDEIPMSDFYKTNADKTWEAWFQYQIANDIYIEFQDAPGRIAPMGDKQIQALAKRLADLAVSMLKTKTARAKKLKITQAALKKQIIKIGQQPYDDDILGLAVISINQNIDFYYTDLIKVIKHKSWSDPTDLFGLG